MAAPKRSQVQIERDRAEIARLYLQGVTQATIGERLDMTQQMVSYDLKAIRVRWRESALINFDEAKAAELAKIDNLEVTYWEAWERSLTEFKSKTIRAKGADIKKARANAEQTIKTEDRNGDPRYLEGVRWCIDRRIKLFGLDEPIKIDWREWLPKDYKPDEVQYQFAQLLRVAAQNADNDED
jgi:hypothetical protein